MKKELSEKQKLILDFLQSEIEKNGFPPTVREICKAVGLSSTSTVHSHLEILQKKGYIQKNALKPRALKVLVGNPEAQKDVYTTKEMVNIPIVGKITAGAPILAVENIEDSFPIPVEFVGNSEAFMLRVRGESMIEAGILDGDLILVKKQNTALNGEIVVALIEDSATVKTFYKENGHIRLQPENSSMEPIIVNDCAILGKVGGVFRKI